MEHGLKDGGVNYNQVRAGRRRRWPAYGAEVIAARAELSSGGRDGETPGGMIVDGGASDEEELAPVVES